METIYFLIVLLVAIIIYAYFSIVSGKQEFVQCVEAGPTVTTNAKRLQELSFYDKHRTIQKSDGQVIDTSGMIRIVVKGNCMKPKNIESGAQLLVKKINKKEPIRNQIKKGDILLIHLSDNGIYKIRIFDRYEGNDLATYRYDDNGERQNSSRNHKESSIIGIVKYRL
ncbi:MAG: hypothetical protein KH057_05340 [Bacteroides sp.]|nr:hypothetical protein [Bacteroides sp.]